MTMREKLELLEKRRAKHEEAEAAPVDHPYEHPPEDEHHGYHDSDHHEHDNPDKPAS